MFKVSLSGYCHTHSVLLAVVDAVLVMDRATRMGDSHDTGLMGNLHTVREGEECIAGHNCTIQVEAETLSLSDCLTQGINAAGLTCATCKQLTVFGQHYGIALCMFHKYGGEGKILCLLGCDLSAGHALRHIFGSRHYRVAVLHQDAVENRA